jgi:hypothetical protein
MFRIGEGEISILPDYDRPCPIADQDDHHLFINLHFSAENLIKAGVISRKTLPEPSLLQVFYYILFFTLNFRTALHIAHVMNTLHENWFLLSKSHAS